MRTLKLLPVILFALVCRTTHAQVGIGTPSPNNSAMLHVESINKGVLFPRMTTAQRTAITQVNGLIVYDTDSNSLYICTPLPTGWKQLKALASLKDLVAGEKEGDILVWDGTQWIIRPITSMFNFYYRDKDGDGYGDQYLTVNAVAMPPGYVANNSDCNDDNASTTALTFYRDADSDGYGNATLTTTGCNPPSGYVANPNDCNDGNAAINPGATEIANGADDDCDGLIDEILTPDLPDDAFTDSNGDGIDGTESAAIFVSGTGNDASAGTKTQPKRTINGGLTAAVAAGKTQVYVGNGTYNERVTLINGISVYGGYSSPTWSRSAASIAEITGTTATARTIGIEGLNITASTTIDRLKVLTANATAPQITNYGLYCNNCTGVTIKNCNIEAGAAGNGVNGEWGTNGAIGSIGLGGTNGSCDGGAGGGGAPGTSACGRSGGAGGNGGPQGSNNGAPGGTGAGGTLGGNGGFGCTAPPLGSCSGNPGANGVNGIAGAVGANGAGGGGGVVSGGYWLGNSGSIGATGAPGNGGGGGGGGGGQGGSTVDDGGGNGGGGGGGGGCPGTGSTGGTAGGSSFGIFLVNSTGIQLLNNTVKSGSGGEGGAAGGVRGNGGNGGGGGMGAFACTTEVGRGGNGGIGGRGGDGGYGGGGAGGWSYGIYRFNTTITFPGTNTVTAGLPAYGGSSPGNIGTFGSSGAIN